MKYPQITGTTGSPNILPCLKNIFVGKRGERVLFLSPLLPTIPCDLFTTSASPPPQKKKFFDRPLTAFSQIWSPSHDNKISETGGGEKGASPLPSSPLWTKHASHSFPPPKARERTQVHAATIDSLPPQKKELKILSTFLSFMYHGTHNKERFKNVKNVSTNEFFMWKSKDFSMGYFFPGTRK